MCGKSIGLLLFLHRRWVTFTAIITIITCGVIFTSLQNFSITNASAITIEKNISNHYMNNKKSFDYESFYTPTQFEDSPTSIEISKKYWDYYASKIVKPKNDFDVKAIFKSTCYHYLSKPQYCSIISMGPYMDAKRNGVISTSPKDKDGAVTNMLYVQDKIYVQGTNFGTSYYSNSYLSNQWVALHELSHVEVALQAGTVENEKKINSRARIAWNSTMPGEVLADCMALDRGNGTYFSIPYYFITVKNFQNINWRNSCKQWHWVIYGK